MPEENMPPHTSRIIHLPLASRSGHHTPICAFSCPRGRAGSVLRAHLRGGAAGRMGPHDDLWRFTAATASATSGVGAPGSACHFGEILPRGAILMMALSVSFS